MTRKELKEHCLKEIEMCEFWAIGKGEKPSGKIYEEHKLILELLDQEPILDKIRVEVEQLRLHKAEFLTSDCKVCIDSQAVLDILDKYKAESEEV